MRPQGYLVAAAALSGMLAYGALAAGALWLARHRASKRTLVRTWVVVGGTALLVGSMALAWLNSGLQGSPQVTGILLGVAAIGLIGVNLTIAGWVLWEWWQRRGGGDTRSV